jgi:hypothetical protein
MVDRVRPLKLENPNSGGTQTDLYPTAANPNQDHLDVRGVVIQNDSSNDEVVRITRDASDRATFEDSENTTPLTLTDLAAGTGGLTPDSHKVLRQLIHFIEEGPAEGFVSGAYKETLPSGNPFPTSIIWWESSSKLKKIVERLVTWTGASPTTDQWKIYDTDGTTVLWVVTDTISYSGPFETTRTRAIAAGP